MRRSLKWSIAALSAATLFCANPGRADLSLGYDARYVGIGGAGLAVLDNPTQAAQVNPAALAHRSGFNIQWPNVGMRWHGASLGDMVDQLTSGSINAEEAEDLARSLGEKPTRLEANLGFGLAASRMDLRARSQANILVTPGAEFTRWATSGQDFGTWAQANYAANFNEFAAVTNETQAAQAIANFNNNLAAMGADVMGAAVVSPSIGIGFRVPKALTGNANVGDLRVGLRAKPTRVFYSHYRIQPDASGLTSAQVVSAAQTGQVSALLNDTIKAVPASEMNGQTSLSETSFGMDMGLLWQPAQIPYTTVALTVDNLIEPSFRVPAGADGSIVPSVGRKLLPRTVSVGAAFQLPAGFLLAADLVDITRASRDPELRVGAELRPNLPILRQLAVRAGYNSGTGFAAGLGIGGFGIAYAARTPLVASQSFSF